MWKRTLCAGALLLGEEAREDMPYGIHGTHFAKIHLSFSYRTTDQMHVLISMQVNTFLHTLYRCDAVSSAGFFEGRNDFAPGGRRKCAAGADPWSGCDHYSWQSGSIRRSNLHCN